MVTLARVGLPTLLQQRVRTKFFLSKIPSRSVINALFAAAQWTPSSHNTQPWRFVILQDQSSRTFVNQNLEAGNEWAWEAPIMIAVWSDPALDDQISGIQFYLYDVGAAVMALTLAALERGLIVNQIAGFQQAPIAKLIGIKRSARVIVLLAVGYPRAPFSQNKAERKPLSEIVTLNNANATIPHARFGPRHAISDKNAPHVNQAPVRV